MDLSKVLGDVYADDHDVATAPRPASAPDWADDDKLDEAFATWTPGPPADAPAAEREMAAHVGLDDDFTALLGEALATSEPAPADVTPEFPAVAVEPDPVVEAIFAAAPEPVHVWSRGDDDVMLGRSAAKRRFGRG